MKLNEFIYLDYAATIPIDSRVVEKKLPYFGQYYGIPSSIHRAGQVAETAIEQAREIIANNFNCSPNEIFFTSGESESDKLSVSYDNFEYEYLPFDSFGMVDPFEVEKRIRPNTAIISVIYGNNEIGTINPIDSISSICRQANIPFHLDVHAPLVLHARQETLNH